MKRLPLIFLILLALTGIAGVVFCIRPFLFPARRVAPITPAPASAALAPAPYEGIIARTLAGYAQSDTAELFAEFARSAVPPPTPEVQSSLFDGYYKRKFGTCVTRVFNDLATEIEDDRALLVWDAAFSSVPRVRLSAIFINEDGAPKIAQLRLQEIEGSQ